MGHRPVDGYLFNVGDLHWDIVMADSKNPHLAPLAFLVRVNHGGTPVLLDELYPNWRTVPDDSRHGGTGPVVVCHCGHPSNA